MTHRRATGGFTLIELLVTVAIIAILAMLAAPQFGPYLANQRVKGNAAELVNDLQFARMESVQRNATATVTFSSAGYTITVGGNTVKAVALPAGSTVGTGATMVAVFNPVRATATLTNGPDVVLANTGTPSTLRVSLSGMGRVSICSPGGAMKGFDTCV